MLAKNLASQARRAGLFLAAMLAASPSAFAQDAANGELIAKTWCAGCHAVESGGAALQTAAAPTFSAIAQTATTSQKSLEIFLMTPHPKMTRYGLTRDEIRDVSFYILSLRH